MAIVSSLSSPETTDRSTRETMRASSVELTLRPPAPTVRSRIVNGVLAASWVMVASAALLTMLLASTKPADTLLAGAAAPAAPVAPPVAPPSAPVAESSALGGSGSWDETSFLISDRISASLVALTVTAPAESTSVLCR